MSNRTEPAVPTRRTTQPASFLGGATAYLLSNVAVAAIPFLLLPILTRYLGANDFGRVAMFQALVSGLNAIVGLSVAGAANRKYFDGEVGPSEMRHFLGACMQIVVTTSVVALSLLGTFRVRLSEWLGIEQYWLFAAVLTCAASVILQLRLGQWQIRRQAKKYGLLQISQALMNMSLSLLLVVVMALGADGRVLGQAVSACMVAVISILLLRRDSLLGFWSWCPQYIGEALRYGIPLVPHLVGLYVLSFADRLVIKQELGLADAGIYVVAAQLAGGLAMVFDAINKAYVPWLFEKLTEDDFEEKRRIVRNTYAWFAMILAVVAIIFLIGPWAVEIIAGPEYRRAGSVIGWLALGYGFGGMYLMVTNYIFFSRRTGLLSLTTVASAVVHIGLLFFMTRAYGIKGSAVAFSLAMGLRFALTWWVAQRRHAMPWFSAV